MSVSKGPPKKSSILLAVEQLGSKPSYSFSEKRCDRTAAIVSSMPRLLLRTSPQSLPVFVKAKI